MMVLFAILAFFLNLLLFMNHDLREIHTLLFLMFGFLAGIKIPAVVLINEKYKPTQRLAVNSAFSKMGLIGNIFGLFITGSMMKNFGPQGLWLSITIILFLFLVFCFINYTKKFIKKEFKPSNISLFNRTRNDQMFNG
jgi:predicted MFS family arabinose efflux permease